MRGRRAWWRPSIHDVPSDQLIHLISKGEQVGSSWLGREFASIIEEASDRKKVDRARKCLENGAGCRLRIKPGEFSVGICCSGYVIRTVCFWFKLLSPSQMDKIIGIISADTALIGSVLSGEVSDYFIKELDLKKIPLLPAKFSEITSFCNCSDTSFPCIHSIAAGLILAESLDKNPWHLFTLKGLTYTQILERVKASRDYKDLLSDKKEKRKQGNNVSGIEIPATFNPVGFYSFDKEKDAIPKMTDDNLVFDPMNLIGEAPYSLGSKDLGVRIKDLYPVIRRYALTLLENFEKDM